MNSARPFRRYWTLVLSGLVWTLAACGSENPPTDPGVSEPEVATVRVEPSSAELNALGATRDFEATARRRNGDLIRGVEFSWSVTPDSVARVDRTGTATAEANGEARVRAEAGGVTGRAALTVEQTVAALEVSPGAAEVDAVGDTVHFLAEARDGNGHPVAGAAVAWSSTDTSVVGVDSAGVATARSEGTARVRARSSGATDAASFSVEQAAASVDVSPDSSELGALGEARDFDAEVVDANGHRVTDAEVLWTSSDSSVAAVDSAGRAVARSNGAARIRAASGGVADSATLVVDQRAARTEVSPDSGELAALGDTLDFDAEVVDANGHPVPDAEVLWSSADSSVAAVDGAGRAVARTNGTTRVRAASEGVADSATLVVDQRVAAVLVSPDSGALASLGDTLDFDAEVVDANRHPVAGADAAWSTTDGSVASVDSAGRAVALSEGESGVVGAAAGAADTAVLRVSQEVASVTVSPERARLTALGETRDFDAELADANGNVVRNGSVDWSVGDTTVATVDTAGRAVARRNGTAPVVADAGGVADTAGLTVEQEVASVTVSPDSAVFTVLGETRDFDADVADANGHSVDGADVGWSSTDEGVATVDGEGRAEAGGAGRARIRAEAGGEADDAGVTLQASEVEVSPATAEVEVGGTVDFDATARDADGQRLPRAEVSWRSLESAVATVNSSGVATGESDGETGITAAADGGAADTSRLSVEASDPGDRDLEAVELDFRPTGLLTDGTTTADAVVRNEDGAVEEYRWRVLEDGSALATGTVSDPPAVDTVSVPGLGPFPRGVHVLTFEVDPGDDLAETDEGNNRAESPIDSRDAGFAIETQLVGPVSGTVRDEVPEAADRWESVVTGDLRDFDPDVLSDDSLDLETCYDGEEEIDDRTEPVDDVLMLVREDSIDGAGGVIARAGPCWLRRPADPGDELAPVPIVGAVTMDRADTGGGDDFVEEVLAHEFGHALGLVFGPDVTVPDDGPWDYTGASGVARYREVGGTEATPPMDDSPHWEEATFDDELMTPFLDVPGQLSVVSLGALADRSYAVDFSAADGFTTTDVVGRPPGEGRPLGDDLWLPERVYLVDVATGAVRPLRGGGGDGGSP